MTRWDSVGYRSTVEDRQQNCLADTTTPRSKSGAEKALDDIADDRGWHLTHMDTNGVTRVAREKDVVWVYWTAEGFVDAWRTSRKAVTHKGAEGLYEMLVEGVEE